VEYWYLGGKDWQEAGGGGLHGEGFLGLYMSLSVFGVVRSGRVGWAGHAACTGDEKSI